MKSPLIFLALLLAGCSLAVEPVGYERAKELCQLSGGLAWLTSDGANRQGTRYYTAVCKNENTIQFSVQVAGQLG